MFGKETDSEQRNNFFKVTESEFVREYCSLIKNVALESERRGDLCHFQL